MSARVRVNLIAGLLQLANAILLSTPPQSTSECWFHTWGITTRAYVWCWSVYWLIPVFCGLSFLNHVAVLCFCGYARDDDDAIADFVMRLRWIEYSVSAGCMTWVIAVLSGQRDLGVLVSLMLLNVILQSQGYLLDTLLIKTNVVSDGVVYFVLFQGFGVFIATWTVIISQFHASVALSATTVPMIVFFIVWVLFLFYCLFGCVPIMLYSGRCCVNSKNYETIFTVLSVVSKTALAWMVARGAARADIWQLAAGVERL